MLQSTVAGSDTSKPRNLQDKIDVADGVNRTKRGAKPVDTLLERISHSVQPRLQILWHEFLQWLGHHVRHLLFGILLLLSWAFLVHWTLPSSRTRLERNAAVAIAVNTTCQIHNADSMELRQMLGEAVSAAKSAGTIVIDHDFPQRESVVIKVSAIIATYTQLDRQIIETAQDKSQQKAHEFSKAVAYSNELVYAVEQRFDRQHLLARFFLGNLLRKLLLDAGEVADAHQQVESLCFDFFEAVKSTQDHALNDVVDLSLSPVLGTLHGVAETLNATLIGQDIVSIHANAPQSWSAASWSTDPFLEQAIEKLRRSEQYIQSMMERLQRQQYAQDMLQVCRSLC